MNIGLTGRVAVAMVALAIATAAVVACVAYVNLQKAALPARLAGLDNHARLLSGELEAHVDGMRVHLLGVINTPPIHGYVRAAQGGGEDTYTGTPLAVWRDRIADSFQQRLADSVSLDQLRLIAVAELGMELVRVDRMGPAGAIRVTPEQGLQPKGHREYVRVTAGLEADQVYVSGIDLNREFGEIDPRRVPVLRIAAPVLDAEGKTFAVAVANVDMRPALARIRELAREGGNVYVVNGSGDYLVHPDPDLELEAGGTRAHAAPQLDELLRADDLTARVVEIDGERVGVAGARVRPAGGAPVTVLEVVPYLELVGPVAVLARSTLVGTVVACVGALLVAALFARSLIRPLVHMTRAVTAAGGEGVGVAAPVDAPGEIGVLARAFERMREEVRAKRQGLARQVEERRRAEERFRLAVEASPNGMLMVSGGGVITLANAEACRMFGWRREELEGNDVDVLVPERFRPGHPGLRRGFSVTPSARLMGEGRELYAVRSDGTEVPVEVALNPIDGQGGPQVLAVVADITIRKAAEAQARRHQEQLERLLAANPDAMVVVSEDRTVHYVNDAAVSLFDRSREDLIGSRFGFELPKSGSSDVEIPRVDGRRKAAMQVASIEWEDEPAWLASLRDVTVERRIDKQLRQAQKMEAIGRLAGGVAHDFNNMLTVIIGYAAELCTGNLDEAQQADLEQIKSAAERASNLSRQLLLHARSAPAAPQPASLSELVRNLEPMLRRVIGADVELSVKVAEDLWPALVDAGQIEQVIMNLVVNARDAMPDGGHLVIETGNLALEDDYAATFVDLDAGDYVMLAVSDTGCGMDADTQQRIFEPFFTTKEDKGTGLGLATSYGVIKQAGGHVNVYSEVGVGTTFKIYLPRTQGDAVAATEAVAPDARLNGAGKLLLVEDNDGVRALVRRVLESGGYDVLDAPDSAAALAVADEHPEGIDLLLTDLVMPGLGGVELAERLRERQPSVRVLFMSGYNGDTMIRSSRVPPGAHYIEKPFTPADLDQRIRDVLGDAPGRASV